MRAWKFDVKLIGVVAFAVAMAACAGRSRRPVVQPAQLPGGQGGTATGSGGAVFPSSTDQSNASVLSNPTDTATGSDALPSDLNTQATATDGSSVTATSTGTATSTSAAGLLVIPLNTEDGKTIQFEWDGVSFKGNDRFDLIHQP